MSTAATLTASEAATQLGVSTKALRIYERRGLIAPLRTAAGYRMYGPDELARAREIIGLRALGLGLAQIAQALAGDSQSLQAALASHEAVLAGEVRALVSLIEEVRRARVRLASGSSPQPSAIAWDFSVAFDLPWPWGGERFELREMRAINYIVGPLGSGKTRFAQRLAEVMAGAVFLGLDRLDDGAHALTALLVRLEEEGSGAIVVDMVEQGLDRATQKALMAHLRQRATNAARPLFLMTRSSAILDLTEVGVHEAILFCPPNHSPPIQVVPHAGTPGYEAVAMCLASPEVRARTAGVIAISRSVASR